MYNNNLNQTKCINEYTGMIIYKQNEQLKANKTLLTFIKIFQQKSKWHLHSNKWHRLKSATAFQSIHSTNVQVLELYSNRQPTLLLIISKPSMPYLKQLNLKNNKIQSIQHLRDFDCRSLRVLNLADNHLTRVTRALNKAYLPNLQALVLYANNIIQINSDKTHLQLNFYDHTQENQPDLQMNQKARKEKGLKQLILGVNCLTDIRWINKISHSDRLVKISLENNRSRQGQSTLKRWKFDFNKILI